MKEETNKKYLSRSETGLYVMQKNGHETRVSSDILHARSPSVHAFKGRRRNTIHLTDR